MTAKINLRQTVIDFLKAHPEEHFTARQIAEPVSAMKWIGMPAIAWQREARTTATSSEMCAIFTKRMTLNAGTGIYRQRESDPQP